MRRLEADVFPALGNKPIADITAPQLLANLCVFAECTASSAHLAIHIHLDIILP